MNTLCYWCFKVLKTESPEIIEFPKDRGIFFCSKECVDHATSKIRGKKELDFSKIKKHANQIKRKNERDKKSCLLDSILKKEKLNTKDLAILHGLLNPKQRLVLTMVGLSQFSWAVRGEPKALMAKIDDLVKHMRR